MPPQTVSAGASVGPSLGEAFNASLPAAVSGGIIGAIVGVLLSLFAVFNLGFSGLFATIVLAVFGFLIGFVAIGLITFFWYALPEPIRRPVTYIVVLGIMIGIIFLAIFFWKLPLTSEYLKFASPVTDSVSKGWHEFTKFQYCLTADPKCPFFVQWEDPNVQTTQEELYVKVDFSDTKISAQDNLDMLVSVSVSNPELSELRIKPMCYLGKNKTRELQVNRMGTYSQGDEFVFGTTSQGQELHTSFRCTGDIAEASDKNVYSEYVTVELERPVVVKAVWPVRIGSKLSVGLVKSEMKFNAPYSIAMVSTNDMPFAEGKDYDFQIVLKRRQEDAKLKSVELIDVKFTDDVLASCTGFNGIDHEFELRDYSYDMLKNLTQYSADTDKFSWPCSIYVSSAPNEAVLSPMELEARYTVYSDYFARAVKSP